MLFNKIFFLILVFYIVRVNTIAQIEYGSHHGKYITIFNSKVYYEEYLPGSKSVKNTIPLLLFHGGMGSIADFKKCIPGLSNKFRVIAIDAPGLGRSAFADTALTYSLMARYYSAMIDQLKLDSAFVIGWSDGGISGLLLAHQRPDKIKKLVAVGINRTLDGLLGMEDAEQTFLNPDWAEKNMKQWINKYTSLSPTGNWKRYMQECKNMWMSKEYFPKQILDEINIPVLVCIGDHDEVKMDHAIEIKNSIRNSQFCVLPNCSHFVFSEKPALINRIAMDFLAGQ